MQSPTVIPTPISLKSPHQRRVENFMRLAKQDIPSKPQMPTAANRRLRAALFIEEVLETIQALGFTVRSASGEAIGPKNWQLTEDHTPDFVEVADGCGDISVVTNGCMSACGFAGEPLLQAIDDNNLQKFGPGSSKDENGKHVKPPGHQPPDILAVLVAQGYEPSQQSAEVPA